MTVRRSILVVVSMSLWPLNPAASGVAEQAGHSPVVVESTENVRRLEDEGIAEFTQRIRLRILTEEGRQAHGQLYFPYVDGISSVRIVRVRTVKPNGTAVEASLADTLDMTPPVTQYAPTFSNLKYKVVPVAGLQVGDCIESESVTTLESPILPGHFWTSHTPTRAVPVLEERVVLDLPADREVALEVDEASPAEIEEREGRRIYRWTLANPEPQEGKILTRRLYSVSSLRSWSEVGEWYRGLFRERAHSTPELEALSEKLTAGRETPREKLQALYDYVSNSVRYVAIQLGLGGYGPHEAEATLHNQYGDCKDKHNLLAVLAGAAGLTVHPALINTQLDVESRVPSPAEFDHVISVAVLGDEWLWLDSTPGLTPLGFLPPAWRGKRALVVLGESESRLIEIPHDSPVAERQHVSFSGRIDETGGLSGVLRYELRGSSEAVWRSVVQQGNPEQLDWLLRVARPFELWEVETTPPETSDPLDLTREFSLEYSLTKPGFVDVVPRSSRVTLPAFSLDDIVWARPEEGPGKQGEGTADEETSTNDADPIVLGGPATIESELRIELPPLLELQPPRPLVVERDFARYESRAELDDRTLVLDRTLKTRRWELPASRRDELRSFGESIAKDRDQELAVRRTGEIDLAAWSGQMDADALARAGHQAMQEGDLDTAYELSRRAVERDPQQAFAWNDLGYVLQVRGEIDEARAAFERQIAINPDDEYAHGSLGHLLRDEGQFEAAVDAYRRQLQINPEAEGVRQSLALSLWMLERWDEVEAVATEALEREPRDEMMLVSLGAAQLRLGKLTEARATFDSALDLSRSPRTYSSIAWALMEAGSELETAERYAESAVMRAEAEMRLLSSLRSWRRYFSLQTELAHYLTALGWARFKNGKTEQAESTLLAALELLPHPRVAWHLAELHAAANDGEAAANWFARAQHLADGRPIFGTPSEALKRILKERAGETPEEVAAWVDERRVDYARSLELEPASGEWLWPAGAEPRGTQRVDLMLLVDEKGAVEDAVTVSGSAPWTERALADAPKLRFRAVQWDGPAIRHLRPVCFTYQTGVITARHWILGEQMPFVLAFMAQHPPE